MQRLGGKQLVTNGEAQHPVTHIGAAQRGGGLPSVVQLAELRN